MHRFYLPAPQCQGSELVLTGAEAHHAADVLRLKPGETIVVLDGAGWELSCRVREVTRKGVPLTVEKRAQFPPSASSVTLVQAVPKGKLIETIIQKATELGVARVVPVLSERVITQLDDEAARQKADKWQAVAIEAIKQCGQRWLPQIDAPISFSNLVARADKFDLTLVGSLREDARHPREYFSGKPESVCVWIGPEGDFTDAEIEAIKNIGGCPMNLGPLILRSDTAAFYALSIVSYELQAIHRF